MHTKSNGSTTTISTYTIRYRKRSTRKYDLGFTKKQNPFNNNNNMALIKSVRGFTPHYGKKCFFADNATIIGDVVMGDGCSIWFNTVLRGDVNSIRIGDNVNIQDGSVL